MREEMGGLEHAIRVQEHSEAYRPGLVRERRRQGLVRVYAWMSDDGRRCAWNQSGDGQRTWRTGAVEGVISKPSLNTGVLSL